MSDRAKKITELTESPTLASTDYFVVVTDTGTTPVTKKIRVENVLNSSNANITLANTQVLSANNLIIRDDRTPVSSTDTISKGKFFFDSGFLYIAVADNLIKRVPLNTF